MQDLIIWGGCSNVHLDRIKIIQNKILRNILKVKFTNFIPDMHVTDMYKELKILKFEDIYNLSLLRFIHFIFYERFDIFMNYFSQYLPNCSYNIRNQRINLPYARTDVVKSFTIFKCCEVIRSSPDEFLENVSFNVIKKRFKDISLSSY